MDFGTLGDQGFGVPSQQKASQGHTKNSRAEDKAAELKERALFMSSNVNKVHGSQAAKDTEVRGRKLRPEADSDEREFKSAARAVAELGASGFDRKKKKEWEMQKLKALGAKGPKNEKVPYNILMGKLKKDKEREVKRKEMEKESGMAIKKAKPKGASKGKTKVTHNTSGVLNLNKKNPSFSSFIPKQKKR